MQSYEDLPKGRGSADQPIWSQAQASKLTGTIAYRLVAKGGMEAFLMDLGRLRV